MTDGTHFIPMEIGGLKFMTIASGVGEDKAVIWRGPLKAKLIDQFIKDTEWGDLDYMVMDFPPGSGDEPLSYYVCKYCGKKHFLFGHGTDDLAQKTGVDITARIPLIEEIGQDTGISKLFLTRRIGELRIEFGKYVDEVMKKLG